MDRHNHHHHHHHRDESPPPPPPQVTHVHHTSHNPPPPPHHSAPRDFFQPPPPPQPYQTAPHDFYQPPPPSHHSPPRDFYQPPPPPQSYQTPPHNFYQPPPPPHHSAPHDLYQPPPPPQPYQTAPHNFYQPPPPPHHNAPTPHDIYPPPPPHDSSSVHHVSHTTDPLANKPSVRVYSKANPDYSLTIRDGKVILAPNNPSDPHQHWVKDLKYSTKVKDEQGYPAFSLVNKATGQAMKHSIGATHPVQLIPYNANKLDESILWTESKDLGDTYRTIRMVNNIRLNMDAFNGDPQHGGVVDGTKIVLWEWKKGDNQRWKIVAQ